MSDDTTVRDPLTELLLQLRHLGRSVRQLASDVPAISRAAQKWTLCFNMDGSLAGIVDADAWRPAGKQLPRISDLLIERQLRLAQVGLVSEGEHFDMGPTYEGIEWDLQAAERGVQLPYLAQPLDTDSDAYHEAYSESWEYTDSVLGGRHDGPETSSRKRASEAVEATELADQIAGVLQQIGFVGEYVQAAEVAAQQLPGDALAALDGLDRPSWRARLRRQVLAEACQWPIDATDHSRSLPTRDESLIALAQSAEPIGYWQDLLSRIDHAVTDLHAASSEITSTMEPDSCSALQAAAMPEPATPEWSRILSKTAAGRLLGCPDGDRACRSWVDDAIADCDEVMRRISNKRYQFDMAWISREYPSLVDEFRL